MSPSSWPAATIVVRSVLGRTACRGHQPHHDHDGGTAGGYFLCRCPRAQSTPRWPPSSGATTPPRPPSTGGSPSATSTTFLARIDGHEQAPITEAARPSRTSGADHSAREGGQQPVQRTVQS